MASSYDLQYDERGRPFYEQPGQRRTYVSPVAMGTGERPKDTTGLFHSAPEWDARKGEWVTPFDWGNLATIGTLGALGGGALSAMGAFGGGAGAGASAAGGAGGGAASAIPATSSLLAGTTAGIPGIAAPAAGLAAGAGAAGGGVGMAGGLLPNAGGALIPQLSTAVPSLTAAGNMGVSGGGGMLGLLGKAFKGKNPLDMLGSLGQTASGAAQGAAEGRRADALAQAAAARVNLDAFGMDQQNALKRSLLGGLQDASISRPAGSTIPTFGVSGGLRPSAFSNKDALMASLSERAPSVEVPKAGFGEKALGGVGLVGNILGSLGNISRRPYDYYRGEF